MPKENREIVHDISEVEIDDHGEIVPSLGLGYGVLPARRGGQRAKKDVAKARSPDRFPLVFISHDSRDAELAEAFSKLLSSVSAGVLKSFRSSDRKGTQGLEYGTEWYPEMMSKLDSATDVVCLLTHNSLDRPWILYEAGFAKGKLDAPVSGIALGIPLSKANTSGPFAQFQNVADDEDALTKLVLQLLERVPGSEPDQETVRQQVKGFRGQVAKVLEKTPGPKEAKDKRSMDEASVAKLFEEVKVMFQDLPERLERLVREGPEQMSRRRLRRFHPMLLEETLERANVGNDDALPLLFVASMVRDDFPWLYELGMEAYRAARAGKTEEAAHMTGTFINAVQFSLRALGPRMGGMDAETYHTLRHHMERLTVLAEGKKLKKSENEQPPASPQQPAKS